MNLYASLCAGIVLLSSLLTGCDSVTQFSISEEMVNQTLQQQKPYSENLRVSRLLNANVNLDGLKVKIARSQPNSVELTGHSKIDIQSILGDQQAEIQLTLRAKPSYDAQQGAIFLSEVEIADYQVSPEKLQNVVMPLIPLLQRSLNHYFEKHAAYTLSPNKSKTEALVLKFAQGLEVKPGNLIILFKP